VTDYNQFKSEVERGSFISTHWCGKTACEEKIKDETMADIRVIPFGSEDTTGKCVYCSEKSTTSAIFARAY
jgi:prolyl-tRNA synthetase